MSTITKKNLIEKISQKVKIHPNYIKNVVQYLFDEIMTSLEKGDRLEFRDFGVFEVVIRKKKIGRNPKNASVPIIIPERKAVKFMPGKKMKELVGKSPSIETVN